MYSIFTLILSTMQGVWEIQNYSDVRTKRRPTHRKQTKTNHNRKSNEKKNKNKTQNRTKLAPTDSDRTMSITIPRQPPLVLTRTWIDVFQGIDQWNNTERFADLYSDDLNTIQAGFHQRCSPKMGHLLAICSGGLQIVLHHIYRENCKQRNIELGQSLTGAGCFSPAVAIYVPACYVQHKDRESNESSKIVKWTRIGDVTVEQDMQLRYQGGNGNFKDNKDFAYH
jgi:hypothetical protein